MTVLGVPWRSQFDGTINGPYNCGEACLAMLIEFFGGAGVELATLRAEAGAPDRDGTTPAQMLRAAQAHGLILTLFDGRSIEDLATLLLSGSPAICDVDDGQLTSNDHPGVFDAHYVVVVGISDDRSSVIINDPADWQGDHKAYPAPVFRAAWYGQDLGGLPGGSTLVPQIVKEEDVGVTGDQVKDLIRELLTSEEGANLVKAAILRQPNGYGPALEAELQEIRNRLP